MEQAKPVRMVGTMLGKLPKTVNTGEIPSRVAFDRSDDALKQSFGHFAKLGFA